MKPHHRSRTIRVCLLLAFAGITRADQTIPGNLTVQQGLLIQQDTNLYGTTSFGHLAENPLMPGFRLSLSQDSTTTQTNVITPGFFTPQDIVVEDYGWVDDGWVDDGYWSPTYGTVTVPDYYPAVYDSEGILVSEGYWGSHDEVQQVGQTWNSSSLWAVTGTHTEQQQTWVQEVVENVTLTNFLAPHVMFNASRSDTNYDFAFPSASGSGAMWTALSIYSGGLAMTSEDTSRSFALTPWSFQQFGTGSDGAGLSGQNSAEQTLHSSSLAWTETSGATSSVVAVSHLRAEALQLVRTESGPSGNTTTQTQIAARSAQFGGTVTVEGNLNVKGNARVLPAGDLGMGAFHKGIKPDGTFDNGN